MHGMDLRALEIFRAVATEGSVSKAATKLNRVQSNVSTRIKQLEERLGKSLFRRRSRGLTLTADGELLLGYADRLLQLSMEASEAMNADAPSGTLRIGAMESTAAARLPDVLSAYAAHHPAVDIALETGTAGALMGRLMNHDIDVAFVAEPVEFEHVRTRAVFTERLVLVVPDSFPELDEPSEVSGRTAIAFETGCAYRRYLDDWLLEAGIVPGGVMAVSSYLAMLACVAAGTGFALVPQSVLDMVAAKGRFRRYPLPGKLAGIKTLLAWREDYRSAKLSTLMEVLPAH